MGKYAFYTIPSIKLSQSTQFSAHNESILNVNFEHFLLHVVAKAMETEKTRRKLLSLDCWNYESAQ